jgi:hypothetical protein
LCPRWAADESEHIKSPAGYAAFLHLSKNTTFDNTSLFAATSSAFSSAPLALQAVRILLLQQEFFHREERQARQVPKFLEFLRVLCVFAVKPFLPSPRMDSGRRAEQ